MPDIVGFSTFEEFLEIEARNRAAAIAAMTPDQRALLDGRGFYWARGHKDYGDHAFEWGYRESLEEYTARLVEKANEAVLNGDIEDAHAIRDEIAEEPASLADGYVFGRSWSEWGTIEDGEWGTTHASVMVEVSRETFELVKGCGWSMEVCAGSSFQGMQAMNKVIHDWNTMIAAQITEEGGLT